MTSPDNRPGVMEQRSTLDGVETQTVALDLVNQTMSDQHTRQQIIPGLVLDELIHIDDGLKSDVSKELRVKIANDPELQSLVRTVAQMTFKTDSTLAELVFTPRRYWPYNLRQPGYLEEIIKNEVTRG